MALLDRFFKGNQPQEEKFFIDSTDDEILETFTAWLSESSSYHDYLLKKQELAEQYYRGNQTERDMLPGHKVNSVEFRIFLA